MTKLKIKIIVRKILSQKTETEVAYIERQCTIITLYTVRLCKYNNLLLSLFVIYLMYRLVQYAQG